MKKLMFFILAAAFMLPVAAQAQGNNEREAVKQAVLDYVEGIYEVTPARIEKSVHPELAKRGFFKKSGEAAYTQGIMTFEQLVKLAAGYNKDGRVPKGAPKEVIIYEVLDQTASVKLIASWGIDYMHLAKYNGKWMICNVMWQIHPKDKD